MNDTDTTYSNEHEPERQSQIRLVERLTRRAVLSQLGALKAGYLILHEGSTRHCFGDPDSALRATVTVLDARMYTEVALGGVISVGEAYMQGCWDSDNLTAVIRIFLINRAVLESMDTGFARLLAPIRKLLHAINRNTRSGSRRNISAHYDLGNDFFKLWLDETMMYSSAVFRYESMTLAEASTAKLERICQKLELCPTDHVLEIGTGWGGFAVHAALHYGCSVTTATISREQYEYALHRVRMAGLEDRVSVLFSDYRELEGRYDKLVSIEMIEAVGPQFMDTYFSQCARLLKPEGMMLLQAITIADQRYKQALKSVDFIQKYIFPGGFLPSVTAMLGSITKKSDMRLFHLEDIGAHYAQTLNAWRSNFHKKLTSIRALGYPEPFIRMWDYYFCYCEGAFIESAIGDVQMLLVKPGCKRDPIVPSLAPNASF